VPLEGRDQEAREAGAVGVVEVVGAPLGDEGAQRRGERRLGLLGVEPGGQVLARHLEVDALSERPAGGTDAGQVGVPVLRVGEGRLDRRPLDAERLGGVGDQAVQHLGALQRRQHDRLLHGVRARRQALCDQVDERHAARQ
jgi:hypothetical protein